MILLNPKITKNHRVQHEIKIQANNDLMKESIMVFSLHNRTYTVQMLIGCKLSRRSKMWDNRYIDKKMYYCINTEKIIIISLQITQAKVEVLVSEILILTVANIFFCRYLLLNFITRKNEGIQMILPYRSCLEFSSLITKLFKLQINTADIFKELLIHTRSVVPVNL